MEKRRRLEKYKEVGKFEERMEVEVK